MTTEGDIPNHVLDSARGFVERLKTAQEDEKLLLLMDQIGRFSPQARTYLQFLTNSFLEKDILDKTMQNPEAVEEIKQRFSSYGVDESDTNMVLDYFNGKTQDQDNIGTKAPNPH